MKKATLIHPRKLTRVMEEFLAQVLEVGEYTRFVHRGLTEEEFDKWINGENIHFEEEEVQVIPKIYKKKGYNNFSVDSYAFLNDSEQTVIDFYYGPEIFLSSDARDYNNGGGFVMADMGRRASYMKGFSQAVRILLHELGHVMTQERVIEEYGEETIAEMRMRNHNNNKGNRGYVRLPDEYAATQWAIDWLADPDHRKIARDFEKKFWTCFA